MPPYRQRTVDTPDGEWIGPEKAAEYLGLELGEFLERVALGVFPPGSASNLRKDQWQWQTIQALSWLRPWLDRLYVERKRARRNRKKDDGEGLPGSDE